MAGNRNRTKPNNAALPIDTKLGMCGWAQPSVSGGCTPSPTAPAKMQPVSKKRKRWALQAQSADFPVLWV